MGWSALNLLVWAGLAGCASRSSLLLPSSSEHGVALQGRPSLSCDREEPRECFAVFVHEKGALADQPVQGSYRYAGTSVEFLPAFPFEPGVQYRVEVPTASDRTWSARFELPAAVSAAPLVREVWPAGDELPANLLRFYITFSNPMERGWQNRKVALLDSEGDELDHVFMNFAQELWSPDQMRLTILFDPGRIKRGVGPHVRLGPALHAGARYTLRVEGGWPDAHGGFTEAFEKRFVVAPAIHSALDPASWTVTAPPSGSLEALELEFDRAVDHALAVRLIEPQDASGRPVDGRAEVSSDGRWWRFHPLSPWDVGTYTVRVDSDLEDLAGNNLDGPLDRPLTAITAVPSHTVLVVEIDVHEERR
jgi:hypothetical protein